MMSEALIAARHEQPARSPRPRHPKPVPPAQPSLILALHAQWEACWAAYSRLEEAQPEIPEERTGPEWSRQFREHFRCKEAMETLSREEHLLQMSILHQVPTTDEELTVLAYHVNSSSDELCGLSEEVRRALAEAISTMFDYLVSEHRADMEKMGRVFSNGAILAFHRRRYRTGLTEEDE